MKGKPFIFYLTLKKYLKIYIKILDNTYIYIYNGMCKTLFTKEEETKGGVWIKLIPYKKLV